MTSARAPGKIILFGEHAVVYGRPAIAIPVTQVQATATIDTLPEAPDGQIRLEAPDIGFAMWLHEAAHDDPIATATRLGIAEARRPIEEPFCLKVSSTIPIASGLGSGTAVTVAILRAISAHLGSPLPPERLSQLAYEVEKLHHGTPSGIDNTVVVYEHPVWFVRGQSPASFPIRRPFDVVIAVSPQPARTSVSVGQVRERWRADPTGTEAVFDAIGEVTTRARQAVEAGQAAEVGEHMKENQRWLRQLGVSTPSLERLIDAALASGAYGAKLSGGGLGGNVIAVCEPAAAPRLQQALHAAGAVHILATQVGR